MISWLRLVSNMEGIRQHINKIVTLAHVKQHLKIVSESIKCRSTTVNIKMIQNYQKKITGKMIRMCRLYNPNSKRCLLCLNEKYEIAKYKGNNFLSKSTEIINTCRDRSKYKLANCGTTD